MDALLFVMVISGVILAVAFAFTNGFQDAATTAATMVASRAATPKQAITLIAVMNGIGALIGGSAVAFTIAELASIDDGRLAVVVMLSALVGAVLWNIITWYFAMPNSSTYGLVGGIMGAGTAVAGTGSILWGTNEILSSSHQMVGVSKVVIFLAISVIFGLVGGYLSYKVSMLALRNAKRGINRKLNRMQWVATSIFALANGANDSQKQMGIIAVIVLSSGLASTLDIPLWARVSIAIAMAFGTIAGGWRVMKTVGSKLFDIESIHSVDSQVVSGASLLISTMEGAPISSTQVVSSSIIGIGSADNFKKVNWSKGKEIVTSWIITLPATALISGIVAFIFSQFV